MHHKVADVTHCRKVLLWTLLDLPELCKMTALIIPTILVQKGRELRGLRYKPIYSQSCLMACNCWSCHGLGLDFLFFVYLCLLSEYLILNYDRLQNKTCWTSALIQLGRAYKNQCILLTFWGKSEKSIMNQVKRGGYARTFGNNNKK